MRHIPALLTFGVLLFQVNLADAQPAKATDDLIYPINPPRLVNPPPSDEPIPLPPGPTSIPTPHRLWDFKDKDGFTSKLLNQSPQPKDDHIYWVSFDHDRTGPIVPSDIRVHALVYSRNPNGNIELTQNKTTPTWHSGPVDFSKVELLSITVPPSQEQSYGIVIGLYYKGNLKTCVSDPKDLLDQFPLPITR